MQLALLTSRFSDNTRPKQKKHFGICALHLAGDNLAEALKGEESRVSEEGETERMGGREPISPRRRSKSPDPARVSRHGGLNFSSQTQTTTLAML